MSDSKTATLATEADALGVLRVMDKAAGYPRKGTGGSLVQVDGWDGTGECPPGWTATAAIVEADAKTGDFIVTAKAGDVSKLEAVATDTKATLSDKQIAATVFVAKTATIEVAPTVVKVGK